MFADYHSERSETPVGRGYRPARLLWWALVVSLGAMCVISLSVWIGAGGLWGGPLRVGFLPHALRSGQFRLFLFVAAGSGAGLTVLVWILLRAARRQNHAIALRFGRSGSKPPGSQGKKARRRFGGEDGTAIIEFALALPILLMLALLMIQSSLLMGGYLCVNYAGYCAARAAIVYVPQDLDEEPANVVEDLSDPNVSEKLSRIQYAAVWAVMPVSDGGYSDRGEYCDALAEGLESFLSRYDMATPGWVWGYLGNKLAYAEQNTSVRLAPQENGESFAEHEDLRVTVSHNLYLSVPYAGWLLSRMDSDHAVDFSDGRYALEVEIQCTLSNEGVPDDIDLSPSPEPQEQ